MVVVGVVVGGVLPDGDAASGDVPAGDGEGLASALADGDLAAVELAAVELAAWLVPVLALGSVEAVGLPVGTVVPQTVSGAAGTAGASAAASAGPAMTVDQATSPPVISPALRTTLLSISNVRCLSGRRPGPYRPREHYSPQVPRFLYAVRSISCARTA